MTAPALLWPDQAPDTLGLVVLCEDSEQEVLKFPDMTYDAAIGWVNMGNRCWPSYRRLLVFNEAGSYHEEMQAIGAGMLTLTVEDLVTA